MKKRKRKRKRKRRTCPAYLTAVVLAAPTFSPTPYFWSISLAFFWSHMISHNLSSQRKHRKKGKKKGKKRKKKEIANLRPFLGPHQLVLDMIPPVNIICNSLRLLARLHGKVLSSLHHSVLFIQLHSLVVSRDDVPLEGISHTMILYHINSSNSSINSSGSTI